ncbi:hypothetical protein ACRN9T_21795 [Shewanella baltica]
MSFTPYMAKLAKTLTNLDIHVKFISWCRETDKTTAIDPDCVEKKILYMSNSNTKLGLISNYIYWMFLVFLYVLKSPDKFYICSRFENAFPLYLASFFKRVSYIYADRDALHLTYNWSSLINPFIKFVESKVALRAAIHLIPGSSRVYTKSSNISIVPNVPSSWAFKNALTIYKERSESLFRNSLKPIVYINGWVVPNRGLHHIENALKCSSVSDRFNFIFAGDMPESILNLISGNESCVCLGRISNDEALSYYFNSDLVITLYNPAIRINALAEPNKWWDCAYTRTKFVANYGLDTVENFSGICEFDLIDYFDEMSLVKYLLSYKENNSFLDVKVGCGTNNKFWDERINTIVRDFK